MAPHNLNKENKMMNHQNAINDILCTKVQNARVLVLAPINRDGYFGGAARKVAKRLTPAEFNAYELQKDEEFDFSQFKNKETK